MVNEYLAIVIDENFPLLRYLINTFRKLGFSGGDEEEMYDEWIRGKIDLILSLFHSFQYLDEIMESVHKIKPKPRVMKTDDIHTIAGTIDGYTLSSLAIISFLSGCEIKAITYCYYDNMLSYKTAQRCYSIVPSEHSLKLCNINKFIKYVYELSFDLYLYEIEERTFLQPQNIIHDLLINTRMYYPYSFTEHESFTEIDSETKSIINKYEVEHQCLLI